MQDSEKQRSFQNLSTRVNKCRLCSRMNNSARILGLSSGTLEAKVMFIGEAPGRLGADATEMPFHGDRAGDNFEELLDCVGISRAELFITNAVLCNPKDDKGNNATPNTEEVRNCSSFLKEQIDLVDPYIVVTLGSSALKATSYIQSHDLTLQKAVQTKNTWYGRLLIPFYHPGQRAMLHRSFANQRSDYQFLLEEIRRFTTGKRPVYGKTKPIVTDIAKMILALNGGTSYFALHKLFYLIELSFLEKFGTRLTGAYFIRQKNGPYCTDLHLTKLKRAIQNLQIGKKGAAVMLGLPKTLFDEGRLPKEETKFIVQKVVEEFGNKTDAQIKKRVYLTKPMKKILKHEQKNNPMYNAPIRFDLVD